MTWTVDEVRRWALAAVVTPAAVRGKYGARARERARELQECIRTGFVTALDNANVERMRGNVERAADIEAATLQIADDIDIDVARLAGPEVVPASVIDHVWTALLLLLDDTGDALSVRFIDERAAPNLPLDESRRPMPGAPRAPRRVRAPQSDSGSFGLGALVVVGVLGVVAFRMRRRRA